MMKDSRLGLGIIFCLLISFIACNKDDDSMANDTDCTSDQALDVPREDGNQTLSEYPTYNETISRTNRIISTNSIPNHMIGLFGGGQGSLNPNAISIQSETYTI